MPVIGFLSGRSRGEAAFDVGAFRRALGDLGYIEGKNVTIEYRWADGQYDRLPALAADLLRLQVSVILATGGSGLAAKTATTTIPIVFTHGGDPVREGLVASLNRPGSNATGVIFFASVLGAKRLELLRQLVPTATTIGVLVNPNIPETQAERKDVQAAAQTIEPQVEVCRVEYPGPGRLERGDRERGSAGEGRSAAEAGVGQGIVRGRRDAPAGVGGAGIYR
jgi:putative ABC transport system substrate-binding protein